MQNKLYHYTSLDTLFAILHWGILNKTSHSIQLKASCIYGMNDPKEMYAGYNLVKKILPQYEEYNKVPKSLRLSEVYGSKDAEEKCKKKYILNNCWIDNYTDVPYVICFSKKKDYLPMWSLYGKEGKGACLIFDTSKMLDYLICKNIRGRFGDVIYNLKPNKNFIEILDYWYKDYMIDNGKSTSVNIDEKIKNLSDICEFLSPYVKYRDYSYESETRIIYALRDGRDSFDVSEEQISETLNVFSQMKHIEQNDSVRQEMDKMRYLIYKREQIKPLRQYVFRQMGIECLSGIMLGPCVDFDVMQPIIDSKLKELGIKIKIRKSKIPYRNTPIFENIDDSVL